MDLNLYFLWRSRRIVLFFRSDSTGREDARTGGLSVWELTGEDEKETEMDTRQKDATYSNKRLQGVVGGL